MDELTIYTDGASRGNPGESAAAWLILRGCDVLESEVRILGVQTNNTAEYMALLGALAAAKKYSEPASTSLTILSDSELMISQMIGKYAVRSKTLKPLYDEAIQTASNYAEVLYVHVPRENAYIGSCDWLCNNALDTLAAAKNTAQQQKRNDPIECRPIGIVHSPFHERKDAPNQGKNTDELSTLEIYPEYSDGLLGLSEGDPVFILCWFDRSERDILQVVPHGGRRELTGVFATRAPVRPNPISLTLVTIISISGTRITVRGLEALNETPVLDIKPYYQGIDVPEKHV
ncbi:tRNA (N6-threonylcarbamoyladenosine(37)-N6)-methyltransferase TrmO [Methanocorpusculum sp. MG]|uniref:tRNA (N6-threonylcarbamoyladenosine(37)-N6)-methyltransferase TrmO n=1 Tax=Methanocorpusculum petauri TaxID=3002863 RepID=A0ABT4IGP5_9EURY|nr:tRNA (N6-threonylcarbamoyladenosine(37)-N6)-methyltransferase TrmO [Methanocorpusculum petauri]MCZ0860915.1 tRNA (N6-threonylcarbamoyladenosine(37)-N6)-methyltransferase TrmO [Methanocorpusculum petauri]MDE2444434.1 tRNA (N6-threonylcarbamoyladenosine(37)-N6)-methyltransferase TrmO [Methanocorpusculum sp.]